MTGGPTTGWSCRESQTGRSRLSATCTKWRRALCAPYLIKWILLEKLDMAIKNPFEKRRALFVPWIWTVALGDLHLIFSYENLHMAILNLGDTNNYDFLQRDTPFSYMILWFDARVNWGRGSIESWTKRTERMWRESLSVKVWKSDSKSDLILRLKE